MKFPGHGSDTLLKSRFFRHDKNFYEFKVPDLYPTFSYDSRRVTQAQKWMERARQSLTTADVSTPNIDGEEFIFEFIGKQRLLERQRLEILLCESPGYILQYAEQLRTELRQNEEILRSYVHSHVMEKYLDCLIVSGDFYYTFTGRHAPQLFQGSYEWWQLVEMIRAGGLEVPPEYANPIPRTGVLCEADFWQAAQNVLHNRIFIPQDVLNEQGGGASAAGGGAGGGSGSGSGSGGGSGASDDAPAPAPAPVAAPASGIGPNGEITGNTNPEVAPETEEESSWWGGLVDAVSNISLSDIVHTTLDVVGLIPGLGEVADGLNALIYLAEGNYTDAALSAAAMIPFAGAAATAAKFAKKTGAGKAMVKAGKGVVNKVSKAASKIDNGLPSGKIKETCTGGCPISMVTGEELLQFTDYLLPGPLPFVFERTYRSGHTEDVGLGRGWTFSGCETLYSEGGEIQYRTDEARTISFPTPAVGETVGQVLEGLFLSRPETDRFELENRDGFTRVFRGEGGRWHLAQYRNSTGQTIDFHYRGGRLYEVVSQAGNSLRFERGEGDLIRGIDLVLRGQVDADHRVLAFDYDDQRNLIANRDASGHGERYQYRNHVLIQRTLRSGFNYYFEWDRYDTAARCLHNWGDGGNYDVRFKWFPEQHRSEITDSRGFTTIYQYNEVGHLLSETDGEGNITHFEHNSAGHLVKLQDPSGGVHENEVNDLGLVTKRTTPTGAVNRTEYNEQGKPVRYTDELGYVWRREYDAHQRLVASTDPVGNTTRYAYNAMGRPVLITRPDGQVHEMTWNADGSLLCERSPDGQEVRYEYDVYGQMVTMREGDRVTRYEYDKLGRATRILRPDETGIRLEYHANHMVSKYVDEQGNTTHYFYEDGLDQITRRVNADGSELRYEYDTERNLTALINENGQRYQFFYDGNENLIKEIGFDGREQNYRYDAGGNLVEHRDGQHLVTVYERNAIGALIKKTARDLRSGLQQTSEFAYDAAGRMTKADNPARNLRFFYGPLGQLLEEWQDNHVIQRNYDQNGNRTFLSLPGGTQLGFSHDLVGRLSEVRWGERVLSRHERDACGREQVRHLGNGVEVHSDYDPIGRIQQIQAFNRDNKTDSLIQRRYSYNAEGLLQQIQDQTKGTTTFSYDQNERLRSVDGFIKETFAFDPAGNILDPDSDTQAQSALLGDRLPVYRDRKFQYDEAGNLVQVNQGPTGADEMKLVYGPDNQLIRVERDGLTTTYEYDAFNRRVAKIKGAQRTEFFWDNHSLAAEHSDAGWKTFVYDVDGLTPLVMLQNDQVFYYHNDHLGTPQEMTDDSGRIVWSARYRAYGEVAEYLAEDVHNPLRFHGQYHDEETGLHYNNNRYYDPVVGRFIHQDPIGLAGGFNLYQYAPNPIMWTDPSGFACKKGKQNTWNEFQKAHKGQFKDSSEAAKAYQDLVKNQSPWPIGVAPTKTTLKPGTKFEMAIAPGQKPDRPGGFGTPDKITNIDFIRDDLAVKEAWKPDVDRVVTYEVVKDLPANVGKVGPQIDKGAGKYLPGGADQVEMLVAPADRMTYIKVVSVRKLGT